MPIPPPRKRFQIHLSTAIVMMFVAGGPMWANMTGKSTKSVGDVVQIEHVKFTEYTNENVHYRYTIFGWPWPALVRRDANAPDRKTSVANSRVYFMGITTVGINFAIALLILFSVWLLCEWIIRRRAVRKGA